MKQVVGPVGRGRCRLLEEGFRAVADSSVEMFQSIEYSEDRVAWALRHNEEGEGRKKKKETERTGLADEVTKDQATERQQQRDLKGRSEEHAQAGWVGLIFRINPSKEKTTAKSTLRILGRLRMCRGGEYCGGGPHPTPMVETGGTDCVSRVGTCSKCGGRSGQEEQDCWWSAAA